MDSEMVQLWRVKPVAADGAPPSGDIEGRHIFPSARQALAAIVSHLRMGRLAYVGIPDYAGHCVIDFLSRQATAVPLRFLPPADAAAVLVYDQWGWQRPSTRLAEVRQRFDRADIIWDRVDSLPHDFAATARQDGAERVYQLFSLSKTLGAGGGGLAWAQEDGWLAPAMSQDARFGESLAAWVEQLSVAGESERAHVDRFLRNEIAAWPPALRRWLGTHSITAACVHELGERRRRLGFCLDLLKLTLPGWMQQIVAGAGPAPGILPVRVAGTDPSLLLKVRQDAGLDLCFYHFDYSETYLAPDWVTVLPVPLHSEAGLSQLERLCSLLRRLKAVA
jgi:hypothetical protein